MSFKDLIKKGKISAPIHRSFDKKKWKEEYKTKKENSHCDDIYLVGLIIHDVLEKLRNVYIDMPRATLNKLLRNPILRLRCSPYLRTVALLDADSGHSLHLFSIALMLVCAIGDPGECKRTRIIFPLLQLG